jgi:hypothetical protein
LIYPEWRYEILRQCVYIHRCGSTCIHIDMSAHMHIYVYIYIYLYTYIQI